MTFLRLHLELSTNYVRLHTHYTHSRPRRAPNYPHPGPQRVWHGYGGRRWYNVI
jgi:hypothetical protein